MIYDAFTLAACAAEMRAALSGLIVHQVRQPDTLSICLVCRTRNREAQALLSADARFARAHLTVSRPSGPPTPPGFCQLLRKHIKGARVEDVRQIGLDRILRIDFRPHEGEATALIHEIMGRHSNIILVNEGGRVLGAAKVVGRSISRTRQVLPGQPYQPPPAPKQDPRGVTADQFVSLRAQNPDADAARWLTATFAGISPVLGAEVVSRAGANSPVDLYESMRLLLGIWERRDFQPVLLSSPERRCEEVYPLPLKHLPPSIQHPRPAVSEALDATVRAEISLGETESLRTELLKLVRRGLDKLTRESEDLLDVLAHPARADDLRKTGQILSAHFRDIPPGASSVTVPDLFDPEMKPVTIALAPHLSPRDNVERTFRLARKAEDRVTAARRRLPEIGASIERLERASIQAAEAQSADELKALRSALQTARFIAPASTAAALRPEERPFAGQRIRTFASPDGMEILMGENAEANDYLTTRVAGANDVWLHARGVKGAHVVIRMAGGKNVPPGTLREAARIAADNSDAKHSSYVPVDWTLRKFVRKPRKSAPGLVTYTHEKTIHVTR